jgi:hypothetical protein
MGEKEKQPKKSNKKNIEEENREEKIEGKLNR